MKVDTPLPQQTKALMVIIIIIIIIGDSYAETTGLRQPGIPPTKVGTRNFGQTCSIGGTPPGKGAHPGSRHNHTLTSRMRKLDLASGLRAHPRSLSRVSAWHGCFCPQAACGGLVRLPASPPLLRPGGEPAGGSAMIGMIWHSSSSSAQHTRGKPGRSEREVCAILSGRVTQVVLRFHRINFLALTHTCTYS